MAVEKQDKLFTPASHLRAEKRTDKLGRQITRWIDPEKQLGKQAQPTRLLGEDAPAPKQPAPAADRPAGPKPAPAQPDPKQQPNLFKDSPKHAPPSQRTPSGPLFDKPSPKPAPKPKARPLPPLELVAPDGERHALKVTADPEEGVALIEGASTDFPLGRWKVPRASLRQHLDEVSGNITAAGPAKNAAVNAVIKKRGELLGRGNDGIVWRVGNKVVKMGGVTPYHVMNGHAYRTPAEARERIKREVDVNNEMLAAGVTGLAPAEFVEHEGRGYLVRDHLRVPKKYTETQLREIEQHLASMHDAGYALGDEPQYGVNSKGELINFDLGTAGKLTGEEHRDQYRIENDHDALANLFRRNGLRYEPKVGREVLRRFRQATAAGDFIGAALLESSDPAHQEQAREFRDDVVRTYANTINERKRTLKGDELKAALEKDRERANKAITALGGDPRRLLVSQPTLEDRVGKVLAKARGVHRSALRPEVKSVQRDGKVHQQTYWTKPDEPPRAQQQATLFPDLQPTLPAASIQIPEPPKGRTVAAVARPKANPEPAPPEAAPDERELSLPELVAAYREGLARWAQAGPDNVRGVLRALDDAARSAERGEARSVNHLLREAMNYIDGDLTVRPLNRANLPPLPEPDAAQQPPLPAATGPTLDATGGKKYRMLGVSSEHHECEACGRTDLKRTVALMPLDWDGNEQGEVMHVGADCAARMSGYTHGDSAKRAAADILKAAQAETSRLEAEMSDRVPKYDRIVEVGERALAEGKEAIDVRQAIHDASPALHRLFLDNTRMLADAGFKANPRAVLDYLKRRADAIRERHAHLTTSAPAPHNGGGGSTMTRKHLTDISPNKVAAVLRAAGLPSAKTSASRVPGYPTVEREGYRTRGLKVAPHPGADFRGVRVDFYTRTAFGEEAMARRAARMQDWAARATAALEAAGYRVTQANGSVYAEVRLEDPEPEQPTEEPAEEPTAPPPTSEQAAVDEPQADALDTLLAERRAAKEQLPATFAVTPEQARTLRSAARTIWEQAVIVSHQHPFPEALRADFADPKAVTLTADSINRHLPSDARYEVRDLTIERDGDTLILNVMVDQRGKDYTIVGSSAQWFIGPRGGIRTWMHKDGRTKKYEGGRALIHGFKHFD